MVKSDSQQLKTLQVQLNSAKQLKTTVGQELRSLQKRQGEVQKDINKLQADIEALKDKDIIVSEHAVLRYMERHYHLDVNKMKSEILQDSTRQLIGNLGDGKYTIPNTGVAVKVSKNVIVTVIKD